MKSEQIPSSDSKLMNETEEMAIAQDRWSKLFYISMGLLLILFAFIPLFLLVNRELVIDIQQVLVAIMTLMIIIAMNFFSRALQTPDYINRNYSMFFRPNEYNITNYHGNYYEKWMTQVSSSYNTYNQKSNLAEAAIEIQELLNVLNQEYPSKTESEKRIVAAKVVNEIENNQQLKSKIIEILKNRGLEVLKQEIINNIETPYSEILIATFEDWFNTEVQE